MKSYIITTLILFLIDIGGKLFFLATGKPPRTPVSAALDAMILVWMACWAASVLSAAS
jgi:hypothetical protein